MLAQPGLPTVAIMELNASAFVGRLRGRNVTGLSCVSWAAAGVGREAGVAEHSRHRRRVQRRCSQSPPLERLGSGRCVEDSHG